MMGRIRGSACSLTILLGFALAAVCTASAAHAFDLKRLDDSVVRVIMFELKDGKRQNNYWVGTGFVVDGEYLVTNHHVVDDDAIKKRSNRAEFVVVDGSTKKLSPAQVIWASVDLDLALIRVPGLKRPALTLSAASPGAYPNKGEVVWAIGYPSIADGLKTEEAFVSSTVTKGVVAKVVPGKAGYGDKNRPIIQHDASIHGGNSGGPLFDNCGVVIGVNTFRPVTTLSVDKDVARGEANAGIFFSPHIVSFIEAQKTVAALNVVRLNTTATPCENANEGAGALPLWVYGVIAVIALMALGATVLALRKGTTREVVRMVESYSAYVKRKGRPPSDESMQPRRVSAPPDISMPGESARGPAAAAPGAPPVAKAAQPGGWKLEGKGSKGQAIRIAIAADDMDRAMAKKEAGIVFGRSGSLADMVIEDETVSRRHAKIYTTEQGLALEDLKSAYGTQVNGHKLEPFQAVEIKAGDKLTLGGVELRVALAR